MKVDMCSDSGNIMQVCWPADPDSEIISFAKLPAKDLKLPSNFVPQMLQSIQMPIFSSPLRLAGALKLSCFFLIGI
jgi:hypothetical protein